MAGMTKVGVFDFSLIRQSVLAETKRGVGDTPMILCVSYFIFGLLRRSQRYILSGLLNFFSLDLLGSILKRGTVNTGSLRDTLY